MNQTWEIMTRSVTQNLIVGMCVYKLKMDQFLDGNVTTNQEEDLAGCRFCEVSKSKGGLTTDFSTGC